MNEENAANRIGNFLIPVLTKNLWKRFCNGDYDALNMIFRRHTDDLYEHISYFSAHSNFEEIKNIVLSETSEVSLKANSNPGYSEKMNSQRRISLSTEAFFL